jgi:hypothetical protein
MHQERLDEPFLTHVKCRPANTADTVISGMPERDGIVASHQGTMYP